MEKQTPASANKEDFKPWIGPQFDGESGADSPDHTAAGQSLSGEAGVAPASDGEAVQDDGIIEMGSWKMERLSAANRAWNDPKILPLKGRGGERPVAMPFRVFQAASPAPQGVSNGAAAPGMEFPGCPPFETRQADQQPAAAALTKSQVNLADAVSVKMYRPNIQTFRALIEESYGNLLRYNVMTGRPEFCDQIEKTWRAWTDVDDARLRSWFQNTYGLYHEKMLLDALQIVFSDHQVNPLIDLLESLFWDGKTRIHSFLHDTLQCKDNSYVREVSRLIFAGGVHRAFNPGCKFDDMIVLIGQQGGGKSTIIRWLNVEDQFFREIKTISGKEGVEALRGIWIAEVAELMAMTRVKDAEAVKAFITTQEDSYRPPYARHVQTLPRRCIFIGTTNNPLFLSDKTGNRRFYPVQCNIDGYDLLSREREVREYIRQCWAEAVVLYKKGELMPYADKSVINLIREEQENAMEDDWRIGAITQYLDQKKTGTISVIELWYEALKEPDDFKPSRKDSVEIGQILNSLGWRRNNRLENTRWGRQKVFEKEDKRYPF